MFGVERLQAIRELILVKKSVEVAQLSQELNVSEVTIRRDLDKLEKEGLIVKTYGGALLLDDAAEGVDKRPIALTAEKELDTVCMEVAKTASKTIVQGETVFVAGNPFGDALVRNLGHLDDVIVVTNNIHIAAYVSDNTKHKAVIVGGFINSETGNVTEYDQLRDLLIEKAFISADGVDYQIGYTLNEKEGVVLYKILKEISRTIVVMADSSIYGKRGLVKMASLSDIHTVVTDKYLPDDFKTFYYENNVEVHSSIISNS